jgi:hypothetical protein
VLVEGYSRVTARLQQDLQEECGLPPTWFEVLLRLARTPGGRLRMTELAGQVSFTSGGFTRLADRLEAAGYLQREPCPTDRRAAFAVITAEGDRSWRRQPGCTCEASRPTSWTMSPSRTSPAFTRAARAVRDGQPPPAR